MNTTVIINGTTLTSSEIVTLRMALDLMLSDIHHMPEYTQQQHQDNLLLMMAQMDCLISLRPTKP